MTNNKDKLIQVINNIAKASGNNVNDLVLCFSENKLTVYKDKADFIFNNYMLDKEISAQQAAEIWDKDKAYNYGDYTTLYNDLDYNNKYVIEFLKQKKQWH